MRGKLRSAQMRGLGRAQSALPKILIKFGPMHIPGRQRCQ
jgi:hypothetical protein